jgi:hypothetical protein
VGRYSHVVTDDARKVEPVPPATDPEPETPLAELAHELALSREIRRRLEAESRRWEARAAALDAEAHHLRNVLAERERHISAVERSVVWKVAQRLRRLLGRAW